MAGQKERKIQKIDSSDEDEDGSEDSTELSSVLPEDCSLGPFF